MIFKPFRPPEPQIGVEYRLYFLDGAGHVQKAHEFVARDDGHAIKLCEGWREGRSVELWQGGRLVLRRT